MDEKEWKKKRRGDRSKKKKNRVKMRRKRKNINTTDGINKPEELMLAFPQYETHVMGGGWRGN
jgi:hypothetical protein